MPLEQSTNPSQGPPLAIEQTEAKCICIHACVLSNICSLSTTLFILSCFHSNSHPSLSIIEPCLIPTIHILLYYLGYLFSHSFFHSSLYFTVCSLSHQPFLLFLWPPYPISLSSSLSLFFSLILATYLSNPSYFIIFFFFLFHLFQFSHCFLLPLFSSMTVFAGYCILEQKTINFMLSFHIIVSQPGSKFFPLEILWNI